MGRPVSRRAPQGGSVGAPTSSGKKKLPPQEAKKKKFGAFGANTFPQNLKLKKDGFENFGGSGGERGG